jgi:hypothetical protein
MMRRYLLAAMILLALTACRPATPPSPTATPTPPPTFTPAPTLTPTPDPCAGATAPGARQKFSLQQITPCLDTISKVSAFMANNMKRDDDWDAQACGGICDSPAWLVYKNGIDDLHGLVTLECYFLEKNGWDAYHLGISIESPIGTNVCGVTADETVTILDADGQTVGTFKSLTEVAQFYMSHGRMKAGGQLRSLQASEIAQVTSLNTNPSLLELPWVLEPY